jgi:hypothetical protein
MRYFRHCVVLSGVSPLLIYKALFPISSRGDEGRGDVFFHLAKKRLSRALGSAARIYVTFHHGHAFTSALSFCSCHPCHPCHPCHRLSWGLGRPQEPQARERNE